MQMQSTLDIKQILQMVEPVRDLNSSTKIDDQQILTVSQTNVSHIKFLNTI